MGRNARRDRVRCAAARLVCGIAAMGGVATCAHDASAQGIAAGTPVDPLEARIVVARSDQSVATWYSLRFNGNSGPVALVWPVPIGTRVDTGSPAFLDALEVATAPRIIPPSDEEYSCPASSEDPAVEVFGDLTPIEALTPTESQIFASTAEVSTYLSNNGLTPTSTLTKTLATSTSPHFVVVRFNSPTGLSWTRPVRIVTQSGVAFAPLSSTEAGSGDLLVKIWSIGPKRAVLDGEVTPLDPDQLVFDAAAISSNYGSLAQKQLASGGVFVQMANADSLRVPLTIPIENAEQIAPVVQTYFDRAAQSGEATGDPTACASNASATLHLDARLGTTCPPSTIGIAGGGAACTDLFDTGEIDPNNLRCGGIADDLAIALSDQFLSDAWITRGVLRLGANVTGQDRVIGFPLGTARLEPVVEAGSVDTANCGVEMTTTSTSSGGSDYVDVPVYAYEGCSCSPTLVVVDYATEPVGTAPPAYYTGGDECGGDGSPDYDAAPPDDCSGDPAPSPDPSITDDGCDCGGPEASVSGDPDGCGCDDSSGSTDDGCSGGDAGGDACDFGGDGCAKGSGCGGGKDFCSVADDGKTERRHTPRRRLKLSILVYVALLFAVPGRRFFTKRHKKARSKKPASKQR